MTEKEMYNFINEQNQETGFAYNEKERGLSNVFSALMRKVYVWMTFALIITGVTAYGVASSPTLLTTIYTNSAIMWGLIIAEFVLVLPSVAPSTAYHWAQPHCFSFSTPY